MPPFPLQVCEVAIPSQEVVEETFGPILIDESQSHEGLLLVLESEEMVEAVPFHTFRGKLWVSRFMGLRRLSRKSRKKFQRRSRGMSPRCNRVEAVSGELLATR